MRASTVEAGAQRAWIVLLACERRSNTEIASLVGVSRPKVLLWRGRYGDGWLAALRAWISRGVFGQFRLSR